MSKSLPRLSHSIVQMPYNTGDIEAMGGTVAIVILCMDSDSERLSPIRIKKMPGPTSGVTAEIPKSPIVWKGKRVWLPVLYGNIADEVKLESLKAFDRVKSQFGLKFGRRYKVLAKTIEELGEEDAVCGTSLGK